MHETVIQIHKYVMANSVPFLESEVPVWKCEKNRYISI
jgi:hypothetical protein